VERLQYNVDNISCINWASGKTQRIFVVWSMKRELVLGKYNKFDKKFNFIVYVPPLKYIGKTRSDVKLQSLVLY